MHQHRGLRESAFTLIELSIVLVIIGLIVGGILVGRDLIKASEVRGAIKQIQEVQAQVSTFRGKFNCLPGDCPNITDFLGTTDSAGHSVANGDGDNLIRSTQGAGAPFATGDCDSGGILGELPQVFLQLNDAKLGNYISDGAGYSMNVGWGPMQSINNGTGLLISCIGGGASPVFDPVLIGVNVIILGASPNNSGNPTNRFQYIDGSVNTFGVYYTGTLGIPIDYARMIDQKIDDALPASGSVGVIGTSGVGVNNTGYFPNCLSNSNTAYPAPSANCNATVGVKLGQ